MRLSHCLWISMFAMMLGDSFFPLKLCAQDSVRWMRLEEPHMSNLQKIDKKLNDIDTTYIEPQHYNFTVMLQNTTTYEVYRLRSKNGHSIKFAPEATVRLGPYFGWRWMFLGYTIDITHFNLKMNNSTRMEYGLSIYSSKIGLDLYHRKTGDNYKIRNVNFGNDIDTSPMRNVPFGGLSSTITGFDIYYIFNHRRFSYPAAFSQSTVQRRSAGSALLGFGYTRQSLSLDWNALNQIVIERMGKEAENIVDRSLLFGRIKYTDVSFSGGYAYNWVFAKNWLLAGSGSVAIAYKHSTGDTQKSSFSFRNFSLDNVNLDAIGRFGLVWNNTRWYAGSSVILHAYSYRKEEFSTDNVFGSLNIYVGYNFGRKKDKK